MALRNVNYIRAQDMSAEQRRELKIDVNEGLVAIETHNADYNKKVVIVKGGIVSYILNGE